MDEAAVGLTARSAVWSVIPRRQDNLAAVSHTAQVRIVGLASRLCRLHLLGRNRLEQGRHGELENVACDNSIGTGLELGLLDAVHVNCRHGGTGLLEGLQFIRRGHPNLVGAHWHQFGEEPTGGRFDGIGRLRERFDEGVEKRIDLRDDIKRSLVKQFVKIAARGEGEKLVVPFSVAALEVVIPQPLDTGRQVVRGFYRAAFFLCFHRCLLPA